MKSWTRPAPALYPHQWSWDSAFIALGLAHLDNRRAARELQTLFSAQWATGKLPHIIFNPDAPPKSYFPDAERWNSSGLSEDAPAERPTSALCQPPVHAVAVLRIWQSARRGEGAAEEGRREELARGFLEESYPRLLSWHRYLATARDPEGSGLVTIYHPWESGTDNSPRFDGALKGVEVVEEELPSYPRYDLKHVSDPSQRPSNEEYDRYLWLLELLKRARYEEQKIYEGHPFLVKDVLFSAILVAANEALVEIAQVVGAQEREEIEGWIERGREGLQRRWDEELKLSVDHDLRSGKALRVRTVAGFAPLIAGGMSRERQKELLETLDSEAFVGHEGLRRALPPSTSPLEEGFHPRSYWRGPVWPVYNWLLWWSLKRAGEQERAQRIRRETLEQLSEGGFAEYFEPFSGEPLGSKDQSWTAAVALDFLAAGSDS